MAAADQCYSNDSGIFSSYFFNFDHLDPHVQSHVMSVYACLSLGMVFAACGAYIHLISNIGEWYFLSTAASAACIVWMFLTHHSKENVGERMGAFNAFTFFSGVSSGPLLELVVRVDPSIVPMAVSGSALLVTSLSLAALTSNDRKFFSMGVLLFSVFFLLVLLELVNTYLGSRFIFDVYVYSSLILFAFFVLYDTQLVVEKSRKGANDFVWNSVALFLDMFQIFKLMLIVLAKKVSRSIRCAESVS
ncbi:hypothetical protein BsWGS_25093 [Bradybaena similaris]